MSGTLKKNKSQRIVWTDDYQNMLLDLWEEKIEDLRGSRKNSHVYQEIAALMQQIGFPGTWADVRTKIDNLTRKYKLEKNKKGPTGGAPSEWTLYNKVHNILGAFKLHNIEICMHESTDMSTLVDNVIEFDPNASCSSRFNDIPDDEVQPAKRKKVDTNAELVQLAKERMEMQRQQQEERREQLGEILKRLDSISSQNTTFQTQLRDILREKK